MDLPAIPARQLLLDAAATLFLAQGFEATSLEQVRLKACVSNGSLYHHYPTKGHLARAVYEDALHDYQGHALGALKASASAQEGVQQLISRHIGWVLRAPHKARVLHELRSFTAVDGLAPDWGVVNAEAFSTLKAWIARHVAEGALQDLPFNVWMALVLAPVMQLTGDWARQERPTVPPRLRTALAQAAWRSVATDAALRGKP